MNIICGNACCEFEGCTEPARGWLITGAGIKRLCLEHFVRQQTHDDNLENAERDAMVKALIDALTTDRPISINTERTL